MKVPTPNNKIIIQIVVKHQKITDLVGLEKTSTRGRVFVNEIH